MQILGRTKDFLEVYRHIFSHTLLLGACCVCVCVCPELKHGCEKKILLSLMMSGGFAPRKSYLKEYLMIFF